MNRHMRRLAQFGKSFAARRSQGEMIPQPARQPDVRTKSFGHGKRTADKWNQ